MWLMKVIHDGENYRWDNQWMFATNHYRLLELWRIIILPLIIILSTATAATARIGLDLGVSTELL